MAGISRASAAADHTDEEIGDVRVVLDFLPPPDRLVLRDDGVNVTLILSRSVAFLEREAQRRRMPYQRLIRALVDAYARQHG